MPKHAPTNAEPGENRPIPHAIGKHTAEAGRWTLVDRAPRVSLAVFFAIAFGGMLIWGIKKETAQIDFQLVVSALQATPTSSLAVQCVYGADEDDTACRSLQGKAEVIRTSGGHHFDGNYDALAQRILDGLRQRAGL